MNRCKHIITLLMVMALLGCGQKAPQDSGNAPDPDTTASAEVLPEGFFLAAPPEGVLSLSEARANARAGETIIFSGYIGGRSKPFTEGRAVFLMADVEAAPPCTDGCLQKWDACCTAKEAIVANSATVQVVNASGQPLRLDLKGQQGLAPGAIVTVVGEVREVNDGVLIVDAQGIVVGDSTIA